MLTTLVVIITSVLLSQITGSPFGAFAWSPTNGYGPAELACPAGIQRLVREGSGLSPDEIEWLARREKVTQIHMKEFLYDAFADGEGRDLANAILEHDSNPIRVSVAVSGGGYRSMLSGAGVLAAMDKRTRGSVQHGFGGLLQAATYVAGCSGGNWLMGTLAWNNWTSVQDIIDGNTYGIWNLKDSIVSPGGFNIIRTVLRWNHIFHDVRDKQRAGFNTSLADVWGRALAYKFFPSLSRGGVGYTWSSIRDSSVFKEAQMPFPISVADGRYPGTKVINLNATVFEFNPFEMGSWDPSLRAFTDVKYLGTKVSDGEPLDRDKCVQGFDNTGFVMGTSATLFNQFLLRINMTRIPRFFTKVATRILRDMSQEFNDVAVYSPNPFKETKYLDTSKFSTSIVDHDALYLVDGGEDDENIPLLPLLQKERKVDIIFAVDNSADMKLAWPDGSSLVHTYERQFVEQGVDLAFPHVPDTTSFVNLKLNKKPTFFGCDASNMTDLSYIPPLVIYLPNAEYSFRSNQSAFKLSYSHELRNQMIKNGFEMATQNNFTDDPEFKKCVACAVMRRKQEAYDLSWPDQCQKCFQRYCWDGSTDDTPISELEQDVHHSFIKPGDDISDDVIHMNQDEFHNLLPPGVKVGGTEGNPYLAEGLSEPINSVVGSRSYINPRTIIASLFILVCVIA